MPHPTESISHVVTNLYNRYPFPQVDGLGRYLQGDFLRNRWNYTLRRRAKNVLPAKMKIWIAGCGTRQAVYVAMNFPEAQVLATDLSDSSLKIATDMANKLELRNLTLRREDLTQVSYKEEFDMIQCYGVLHCLENPVDGFRVLRRALKPDGAASIMLYNIRQFRKGSR